MAGDNSTIVPNLGGTSYATPHVTGTVALLQQFANDKVTNVGGIHWGNTFGSGTHNHTAKRHEVMKAVLLNSADKLFGIQGSLRDVERRDGSSWFDTPAASNPAISLDLEFGAGHLNAQRALWQFENGEWDPFAPIPSIGWDFGETGGPGTILRYPFDQSLQPGAFISVTLAWDRFVDKTGSSTSFSPGDIFFGAGMNDLDIYLMPAGWVDFNEAITGLYSVSANDNVEHFFGQIPSAGDYEIVVNHFPGERETDQHFALAWWYGVGPLPFLPGDFNEDGNVDGRDFLAWQRGESPNPLSTGDLADWQNNYGTGSLVAEAVAVPGPSCVVLLLGLALPWLARRGEPGVKEIGVTDVSH